MTDFLYIHIPFCIQKCLYCDFFSVPYNESLAKIYIDALCKELHIKKDLASTLKTIYIGGGTPSLLPDECLQQLFQCLRENFYLSSSIEITVEANPGTINESTINTMLSLGVNRLSIGIQSFDDRELKTLGRFHNSEDALRSIELMRRANINNFSIDMMYGIPGQTIDSWKESLSKSTELSPTHISAYELTLEENTPLYKLMKSYKTILSHGYGVATISPPLMGGDKGEGVLKNSIQSPPPSPSPVNGEGNIISDKSPTLAKVGTTRFRGGEGGFSGKITMPDEDIILAMYNHAIDYLARCGYEHYEISNFAKPGCKCIHNLNYWDRGEYIGVGAGAHSFINGIRSKNIKDINQYIAQLNNGRIPAIESTKLTSEEAFKEFIFLGLRKMEGISINKLPPFIPPLARGDTRPFNPPLVRGDIGGCNSLLNASREFIDEGYLVIEKDYLRLTRKGIVISNTIIVRLFEKLGL